MAGADSVIAELLGFRQAAYVTALRVTGRAELAEEAVQEACLRALAHLRAKAPPARLRVWFITIVLNSARNALKAETRLKRRELAVEAKEAAAERLPEETAAALREEMLALDERYRLPVSLCYEQGFSQREAAEILECPVGTVASNVSRGLERLRLALEKRGITSASAALVGGLQLAAPQVPAGLLAGIEKILTGTAAVKGTGLAVASAAAKGGLAMKVIVGVVAAGVLAGAVAVVIGPMDPIGSMGSPPAAAPAEGKPAPINEYKGMQEREEVFEFTEKPKVTKEGDKWIIAFTSKGKCDATVTVLGPDGKVVRHLASGVLGVNAPRPFQQLSLAQKVEWDGLTDTFQKAPAGCKIKVSLGLKPEYDGRNIMQPPHNFVRGNAKVQVATDKDGNTCVAVIDGNLVFGHVYDKAGKYLRAFWPPPAKDIEKMKTPLTTTKWGDKTPWSGWFGPFVPNLKDKGVATPETMLAASGLDPKEFKPGPLPASLPKSKLDEGAKEKVNFNWFQKWGMFWVDPETKTVFSRLQVLPMREETGEIVLDGSLMGGDCRGFDGLYYGNGDWWHRGFRRWTGIGPKDPSHPDITPPSIKYVPWKASGDEALPLGILGSYGGCGCSGYDVTETGDIVGQYSAAVLDELEMAKLKVNLGESPQAGEKKAKELGFKFLPQGEYILVWDKDGNARTRNAIENLGVTTGAFMDRDGNLYTSQGFALPAGQKELHGVAECPGKPRGWGGTILKFRGLGNKYPLGRMYGGRSGAKEAPPADAVKLAGERTAAGGALWGYGGISNCSGTDCECNLSGFHLDHWSRLWVPNNAACGVMVVDSNGNFVMRIGKYGNVDDEGARFAYIRSVFATDEALYVYDMANARLSKILLKYGAEETAPAP